MSKHSVGMQQSVLDRLRSHARSHGQTFEEVLTYYGIERFLYRLSRSKYGKLFVLKGALLMMTWPEAIQRTTRDIDLRAYTKPDSAEVAHMLREVCVQPVEDDGLLFDPASVEVETIAEHARYPGVRAKLWGTIGRTRVRIRLDISFSDPVTIDPDLVDYPTILDMPAPRLHIYPKETVVAEKLEAIVQLGQVNSRMKDFFDLHAMARAFRFDGQVLVDCIRRTFEARSTAIPAGVPVGLTDDFARAQQGQWRAFLHRIGQDRPKIASFQDVIRLIRKFAMPALSAARLGHRFDQMWSPSRGWAI